MTEYASRGDHRRTMELLWGQGAASNRGPKPGLELATVVRTAIELADADGLAAVSMRKIAERLGRSAMALYTYVPGKAELLDLMLDTVYGEDVAPAPDGGWRVAAEASARATWELYLRHPWVLQVAGGRPVLGPNELDAYESLLRIFDGLGLSATEVARSANALAGFVRGAAKAVSDARAAEQATGLSDDEWWNARSPLLDEMVGDWEARFPVSTRLSAAQAFDQVDRPDDSLPYTVRDAFDTFDFGLQRLLDGFAAHIAAVAGRP